MFAYGYERVLLFTRARKISISECVFYASDLHTLRAAYIVHMDLLLSPVLFFWKIVKAKDNILSGAA